MNYFEKLFRVFARPRHFFKEVEKEFRITNVLLPFAVVFLIVEFISMVLQIPQVAASYNSSLAIGLYYFFMILIVVAAAFAGPFISAGITHLGVMILGGKQGFFNTFKPVTYGSMVGFFYSLVISIVSAVFFAVFPSQFTSLNSAFTFIGVLAPYFIILFVLVIASVIHSLYVQTVGLAMFQRFSPGRAFLSLLIIPVLLFFAFIIMVGIFAALFSAI